MSARRSSLLAFGLSLLLTSVTAGAVDPSQSLGTRGQTRLRVGKLFATMLLLGLALQGYAGRAYAASPVSYPANIMMIGYGPEGYHLSAPGCFSTAQNASLFSANLGAAQGADTSCIQAGVARSCGACTSGPYNATGFGGFAPIINTGYQVLWQGSFSINTPSGTTSGYESDVWTYCPNGGTQSVSSGLQTPGFCLVQGDTVPPRTCPAGQTLNLLSNQCDSSAETNVTHCNCPVGDPIYPASGNLYETVTDYKSSGPFPLVFERSYNSLIAQQASSPDGADFSMGPGWTTNLAGSRIITRVYYPFEICPDPLSSPTVYYLCPSMTTDPILEVTVWHKDGSLSKFTYPHETGNDGTALTPEPNATGELYFDHGGNFRYVRTDGYAEIYSMQSVFQFQLTGFGNLTEIQDPDGLVQTYAYNYATTLSGYQTVANVTITDPAGRQLTVNYDTANQRISSLTVPSMNATTGTATINYGYDSAGNLQTVTYQDSTVVTYEYNDSTLPHALTGLKDEDGDEYAAWSYDDTSGKAICSEHAPSGNVPSTATTCISDAGGVDKTVIAYNGDGSADVTEPTGLVRHMTFTDINGRSVFASVDKRCPECGDTVQQAQYDANGHLSRTFDFDGNETDYSIDAAGFEQSRTEAVGTTDQRTTLTTWYTPAGGGEQGLPKTVTEEDAAGNPVRVTSWCYNLSGSSCVDASAVGAIWSQTVSDPVHTSLAGRTTTYTYTTDGRLQSVDGPLTGVNDVTTLYDYPDATHCASGGVGDTNDVCMIKDGKGHKTYINQYSAAGFPASLTDPNGVVTALNYDPRGRLLSRILDSGGTSSLANATTTYTYYNDGLLHTVALPITAAGHAYESYSYDRAHRLTGVVNDAGESKTYTYTYNTTAKTYDVEEQRFTSGGVTPVYDQHATRDDALDQLRYTNGLGKVTTLQVDVNGNVTGITDPLGHATTVAYDALNRRQQLQDANGGISTYVYDVFDNPADVTSPRGLNTGYVYDAFGELLSQVSPDTGTTSYDYSGWVSNAKIVKTDARNKVQTYTYDALYRLLSQSNGQRSYTYTYDNATSGYYGIGRLDTATILGNSEAYRYDSHGMVSRRTTTVGASGQSFIQAYYHDAAGNVTSVSYPPANGTVVYDRDSMGRVTEVHATCCSSTDELLASNITYMPFGPLSGLQYGNNLVETRSFDAAYRLTDIDTPGTQVWHYDYNGDDTIEDITDSTGNAGIPSFAQTFSYDPMQRLVTATGSYGSITIGSDPVNHPELSYDADGNRTQIDAAGTVTGYTYDPASNRLLSSLTGGHTTTYGYDADGSVTSDGTYTYVYDINERVATVQQGSTVEYQAQNNYLGQRISKTVGTAKYGFVYDEQGHLIAELNTDGTILKEHVWLGDRPLAYYQTNINGSTSADVKYLHVDQVNAPRLMTTSTKAVGWTWNSDPWGTTSVSSGSYHIRYPGQYYDSQTGNMQNWMRDYDPQTGRYLESDPIGLVGGINTYSYAFNNPLRFEDPFGLDPPPPQEGVDESCPECFFLGPIALLRSVQTAVDALIQAERAQQGLPPKGTLPPVDRPQQCKVGPSTRGDGSSLWDENGGEWRYFPGDKWHNPHWDYNPWNSWNSPWQNKPIGGVPPVKPTPPTN